MIIASRIRALRKAMNLTQQDIQKRTGLLTPYLSRIENGHTSPSLQTLEKLARVLELPLYALFYDKHGWPNTGRRPGRNSAELSPSGNSPEDALLLKQFQRLMARLSPRKRELLLTTAEGMAARKSRRPAPSKTTPARRPPQASPAPQ